VLEWSAANKVMANIMVSLAMAEMAWKQYRNVFRSECTK